MRVDQGAAGDAGMLAASAHDWRFEAIGAPWRIVSPQPVSLDERADVMRIIDHFDLTWSRFRADSAVSRLAERGGKFRARDAGALFDTYRALADATADAVNPLVGDALARLGYAGGYRLTAQGPPLAAPDWQTLLAWNDETVELEHAATIDIGAIGKGRLVDLIADALPTATSVDASGDLAVRGAPQRVALEHPHDASRAIGVITLENEALCASATNRRAWGDGLHHVLDARTGLPIDEVVATWAVAPTAMIADAAATALFFDGGPGYANDHDVHWVRMFTDGRAQWRLGDRLDRGTAEVFR